eukprot:Trichotokara_eunicae@DN3121_c0_g1_i2.p1
MWGMLVEWDWQGLVGTTMSRVFVYFESRDILEEVLLRVEYQTLKDVSYPASNVERELYFKWRTAEQECAKLREYSTRRSKRHSALVEKITLLHLMLERAESALLTKGEQIQAMRQLVKTANVPGAVVEYALGVIQAYENEALS